MFSRFPMSAAWLAAALVLVGTATAAAETRVPIAADGKALCPIVITDDADAVTTFAAEELRDHLTLMTGAELPIRRVHHSEIEDYDVPRILIGELAGRSKLVDSDGLGPEGYMMRADGRTLAITGGRPRGVLYGVYRFLDRLGVRWWTPFETFVPKRQTLTITELDLTETPGLAYRDIMARETHGEEGQLWMARNRMNGMIWKDPAEKLGGRYRFGGKMLAHTLMQLLKKHKVEVTPEMMSMNKAGQRAKPLSRGHQVCFTSRDAIEAMARVVVAEYEADPDIHFVMLGQEDGYEYCHCPDCAAITEREGAPSGAQVHFANEVLKLAQQDVPGAAVAVNAYVWSRKPPKNIKPLPNVYVVIASYEVDFGTPLAGNENWPNWQYRQDHEGWDRITERMYVWDYVVNFFHYLMPHPNLDVLGPNIKYYRDHGCVGVMSQGAWNVWYAEHAPLQQWVLGRVMWDPEAASKALIEQFCRGYYGPAGDAVLAHFEATHRYVRENPKFPLGIYRHTNSPHIAPEVIAPAEAAMQEAERLAAESKDADIIRRVRHAHLPVRYVLLKMGPRSPMARSVEAELGEPLDLAAAAEGVLAAVADTNIGVVSEGAGGKAFFQWVADYGKACASGRMPAPPALAGDDVNWTTVRLIQGCQMEHGAKWCAKAEGASDGWAIRPRMGRNQLLHYFSDTNDYTPGKSYRAFVRIRAEGLTDKAEGELWSCQVGKATLSVTADALRDGKWRTFEVGTVAPEGIGTAVKTTLLWKLRDTVKHVDIDCLWLVEAEKSD